MRNSDLSTTYLGKSDRSKNNKLKAEESFLISEQGYMLRNLLDKTECQLLYKYREVFSMRDEIDTCPNIEVKIDVTNKSPFFIRPYHVKEEDKTLINKEMKRLCYLGILKEGFSPYSSPVMLISRKLMKYRRVVTYFRHLNVRIVKKNLAYLLLKDKFLVPHMMYYQF